MKFLLFNLVVTGSLIYLMAGPDLIPARYLLPAEDRLTPVEPAASGGRNDALQGTRDRFQAAVRHAIEEVRSGAQEGPLDLEKIEADQPSSEAPLEEVPPIAIPEAGDPPTETLADEPPVAPEPREVVPAAAEPELSDPPREIVVDETPAGPEPADQQPPLKAPPPPVDTRIAVQVVETTDQEVIRRRAELLGDDFKIAGSEPSPPVARAPRRDVKPSREIAAMSPQERSRDLDRLALDMELMFAERVGR